MERRPSSTMARTSANRAFWFQPPPGWNQAKASRLAAKRSHSSPRMRGHREAGARRPRHRAPRAAAIRYTYQSQPESPAYGKTRARS